MYLNQRNLPKFYRFRWFTHNFYGTLYLHRCSLEYLYAKTLFNLRDCLERKLYCMSLRSLFKAYDAKYANSDTFWWIRLYCIKG